MSLLQSPFAPQVGATFLTHPRRHYTHYATINLADAADRLLKTFLTQILRFKKATTVLSVDVEPDLC